MRANNLTLFIIPALIWGSTWYVITYQLGKVDPLISVVYRYFLAGVVMMVFCLIKGVNLKYSLKEHGFMALQGLFLFGINYWLVYEAEQFITSGLMAVAFSTIIFFNSGFGAIFLGKKINKHVIIAAILGLSGTILIFKNEFTSLDLSSSFTLGASLAVVSVIIASFGNLTSARNSANNIPVLQANAFGMIYGCIAMFLLAIVLERPFTFDYSTSYIVSLIYLALFGSIIAFAAYLTLIGRIGADKAAYALVVIPILSIVISVIFEGYEVTPLVGVGMALIIGGNMLALKK